MIVKVAEQEYYLDGYLKSNLDYVKQKVLAQNDMLICIIDGRPGAGKSTLAAQCAYYLTDGKFTLDNISFTGEQTSAIMNRMQPGDAIIIDESFDQMNRRTAASSSNMVLLSMLQRMRSKRVFIFILLPYIYDLDKNVILGLCNTFLHCYRAPFGPRGQFCAYDEEAIKKLWLFGRQSYSYSEKITKANFRSKFVKHFPLDFDKYEETKQTCMELLSKKKPDGKKYLEQRNKLLRALEATGKAPKEMAELLGLTTSAVYKELNRETQ